MIRLRGEALTREIARLEHATSAEMLGPPIALLGADPEHCQWCACYAAGHRSIVQTLFTGRRDLGHACGECHADLTGLVAPSSPA